MKKNNVYSDLLVGAVVQNVNTYDDFELLEAENDLASETGVNKSESVLALLNSDKEITEKELRLKPNKNYHRMNIMLKVAVIFLVFCTVSIITVSVAKGFNIKLPKMFSDTNKGKAEFGDDSMIDKKEESVFYTFSYIPPGFKFKEQLTMKNCVVNNYVTENEDAEISISQYIDYNVSLDMDNGYETLIINDIPCYYFANDDNYLLLFETDDLTCLIGATGNLDFGNNIQDEFRKIVESVEK